MGIEIVPQTEDTQPIPKRETIAGTWEFRLSNFTQDIVGILLEVAETEDGFSVKILDDSQAMPKWAIESSELTKTTANIRFANHNGSIVDFRGILQDDGIVRGNVAFGTDGLDLVLWVPSRLKNLDSRDQVVEPQRVELMEGFQPEEETFLVEFRDMANKLVPSTLAYHFFKTLANRIRSEPPEAEYFEMFPEEYLASAAPWGDRVVRTTMLDIAFTAAVAEFSVDVTNEYLAKAADHSEDELTPGLQILTDLSRNLVSLKSEDVSEQESGVAALAEMLDESPYNTTIMQQLAGYYEESGQLEQALTEYATLAALPLGVGSMSPVMKIWQELGRDPNTVDAYLDDVYQDRVHRFADKSSEAVRAEENQKTVLGELFTGASCGPCVSADVATGGLEKTYPRSDFIMLRYHQHSPAPDPLAVPMGEQRGGSYYQIPGTPVLVLNGQLLNPSAVAGNLYNAPNTYSVLREVIDDLLAESSDVAIELQATMADESIAISASVTGSESFPEDWRLRLCLAEDEIVHPAPNGVRVHEMVVRAMPGGVEGIAPTEDGLTFDSTITLQEVRDSIRAYLVQFPGLSAPQMDMEKLHIVAFVQDDADRSILQAKAVPVTIAEEATQNPDSSVDAPSEEKIPSDESSE